MKYNVVVEGVYQSINFCPITNVQKEKLEDFSERNNVSFSETLFNDSDEILGLEWSDLCDDELIKGVIPEESEITIYDHHPNIVSDIPATKTEIEPIGSTTTLIVGPNIEKMLTQQDVDFTFKRKFRFFFHNSNNYYQIF